MPECVYIIHKRAEAQFAGRRIERSFLPQVLRQLCFFVLEDQRVYVVVDLSEHAAPELLLWVRSILGECGERCDPQVTLAQLTREPQRFCEVYLGRGEAFLELGLGS